MGSKSAKYCFGVSAFSKTNKPDPLLGQKKIFSNIHFSVFKGTGSLGSLDKI
jgi:hypothetical protein